MHLLSPPVQVLRSVAFPREEPLDGLPTEECYPDIISAHAGAAAEAVKPIASAYFK